MKKLLKNCSPWEETTVRRFILKDCSLWKDPCRHRGKVRRERSSRVELSWIDHSPQTHHPAQLKAEWGGKAVRNEGVKLSQGKKKRRGRRHLLSVLYVFVTIILYF